MRNRRDLIGWSPDNWISPIDFIPVVGPLVKLNKAFKLFKTAKKTRKGSGAIGYINAVAYDVGGLLNLAGAYALSRATTIPAIRHAANNQAELRYILPGGSNTAYKTEYIRRRLFLEGDTSV